MIISRCNNMEVNFQEKNLAVDISLLIKKKHAVYTAVSSVVISRFLQFMESFIPKEFQLTINRFIFCNLLINNKLIVITLPAQCLVIHLQSTAYVHEFPWLVAHATERKNGHFHSINP